MGKTIHGNLFNVRARINSKVDPAYIDIRVDPKTDAYKQNDIGVYTKDGVRLKVNEQDWNKGTVTGGYSADQLKEINTRITALQIEVSHFVENNPNATKQVIESHIYGENLKFWKKQRIKFLDVPVFKKVYTDLYKELRQINPKEKIITTEKVVSVENEFKVTRVKEVEKIIDPLSLEDFPNQFDPTLYEFFKKEYLEIAHNAIETIHRFTLDDKERFDYTLNQILKGYIQLRLYKNETEYVRVNKQVLDEYEKHLKKGLVFANISEEDIERFEIDTKEIQEDYLLNLKEKVEQKQNDYVESLLSPEDRYNIGKFNKEDIFEIFTSGFYTKFPNQINKPSILWRLLEYKMNANPPSHIKDFSVEWSKAFLSYIFKNGVKDTNFRGVDPTTVTKETFAGKRIFYTKDRYADVLKWYKDAVNKLTELKRLPLIDLKQVNIKMFYTQQELKNIDTLTQDEKFITKPELDKLLYHEFSTNELNLTRDRFILLLMFGGLRINEFRPDKIKTGGSLHIEDDGYGTKFVSYYTSHNQKLKEMANPINEYTDIILKKYKYKIPFYTDKKGKASEPNEGHFNKSLKLMAKEIGIFKRKVKDKQRNAKGEMTTVKVPIENDFSSLYARHSIYPIFKYKEMPKEQIMTFVGHSGKRDSSNHYDPKLFKDVAYKRKLIEKYGIKPD